MAKAKYVEPANYIPEEIQKKYGVGKYYNPNKNKDQKKEEENKEFRKALKGE